MKGNKSGTSSPQEKKAIFISLATEGTPYLPSVVAEGITPISNVTHTYTRTHARTHANKCLLPTVLPKTVATSRSSV
jgi:hypothetical protein